MSLWHLEDAHREAGREARIAGNGHQRHHQRRHEDQLRARVLHVPSHEHEQEDREPCEGDVDPQREVE